MVMNFIICNRQIKEDVKGGPWHAWGSDKCVMGFCRKTLLGKRPITKSKLIRETNSYWILNKTGGN